MEVFFMFNNNYPNQNPMVQPAQVMGGYNPMYGGYNPMMNPVQPMQPAVQDQQNVQFLTAEQIAELQKQPIGFQGRLTREEYLRAICTHKDAHGHFSINEVIEGTGRVKCSICGAEWNLLDLNTTDEEVARICNDFLDLFQSIKTYYGNVPVALKEIYIIAGLIGKVPQLWKVAKKYFENSSSYYQLNPNQQYGNDSTFGALGAIFGGMGGNFNIFNGMQTGGINPYFAANQQPVYAPAVPAMAQVNQPQFVQQNGMYVPQAQQQQQTVAAQAPAGQTYGLGGVAQMGTNPIGYVEQTNQPVQPDFTKVVQQPQQAQTVQNVAMPGPSVTTVQTPPMPEAPKNPNLQEPAKA